MQRWLTRQHVRKTSSLLCTGRATLCKTYSTEKHGWITHTIDTNSHMVKQFSQSPITLYKHKNSGATLVHIDNKNDPNNFNFQYVLVHTL
jgi:hypothetical protein